MTVVNDLPLETYLRGVVPAEMSSAWPTAALEAQTIASRSYAARHLRPGVSYYDVVDTSAAQVYRGAKGEKATTNAIIRATRRASSCAAARRSPTRSTTRPAAAATENNENVYTSATGAKVAGVVSYLRGSSDRAPDGTPYDAGAPYATWATATYTIAQLSAWFAADARTNVGTLTALDLRDRGVSGRLISVTLIGSGGTKKVSGEVFRSVFNARRPAARPDAPQHAVRDRADPLTRAILGAMIEPRGRCAWAGADGPNPDPLMVAYHDDEWGDAGPRRHRAVRAARARIVPGGPVVVDHPAQARGLPRRRSAASTRAVVAGVRRGRPGAPDGRCRDRPERRQDRRDGRQRRRRSWPPRPSSARSTRTSPTLVPPPPPRLPATARAGDIPATTPASDALSADLKRRGFRFVGSTIVYAFMQSVGLVDDHLPGCFRYARRGRDTLAVTGQGHGSGMKHPTFESIAPGAPAR